jgi:site-specific DNA-methyltransferase (adenine-specific)
LWRRFFKLILVKLANPFPPTTPESTKRMVAHDEILTASEVASEFCANSVTLARRWVVMSCAWQHAAQLEKAGVMLGIWYKPNGALQFTGDRPGMGWEAMAILHCEGKKRWNGGGHHADWVCNVEHGEHPTQKALKLVMEWVAKFTDPGETALDPFMGSGTTGIACAKHRRKFIGIEKRPAYFDLACRRIAKANRQADMFAPTGN